MGYLWILDNGDVEEEICPRQHHVEITAMLALPMTMSPHLPFAGSQKVQGFRTTSCSATHVVPPKTSQTSLCRSRKQRMNIIRSV